MTGAEVRKWLASEALGQALELPAGDVPAMPPRTIRLFIIVVIVHSLSFKCLSFRLFWGIPWYVPIVSYNTLSLKLSYQTYCWSDRFPRRQLTYDPNRWPAQVIPGCPEERIAAPHTTLWLSQPGHVSGRSQTCAHPALMGGFYAPVFCWCDIRVMISDVKIIQLCWWVSPKGSYPSMASTTLGIKTHQSHYLLLSIFTDW